MSEEEFNPIKEAEEIFLEDEKSKKKKKYQKLIFVLKELRFYACVIVGCLLFVRYIACFSIVNGNSMYPSFEDGDRLFLQKVSYYFTEPERFDVVVFDPGENYQGEHFIKRIIGLPGETVQVIDGYFYINGEKLESDIYGNEPMEYGYRATEPITLGEDEYFVAGDNRNHSNDSRSASVGNVNKSQILGKVLVRIYPFSSFRFY